MYLFFCLCNTDDCLILDSKICERFKDDFKFKILKKCSLLLFSQTQIFIFARMDYETSFIFEFVFCSWKTLITNGYELQNSYFQ